MSETTEGAAETVVEVDENNLDLTVMAAVGSVALALYYYYVRGNKQRGEFIGLWPGTILGLATYIKLGEIKELLQESNE
ncbi:hypothetical protein ACFQH2_17845 [Natronoarchaeum sp. GCM10025703]|uniref:hypothetical protein n=1 Tax=unclassified Natronoarchaeum TaxID=2620183 RepID=UPI00360EDE48